MPWPCCVPHCRVRRMSMSRVPCRSSIRSIVVDCLPHCGRLSTTLDSTGRGWLAGLGLSCISRFSWATRRLRRSVSCDGNQRIRAWSKPPERRLQPGLAAPLSAPQGCARYADYAALKRARMKIWRIPIMACLIANVCFGARPVIFDTDMGNDIDDAMALAMLHALSDRGECDLIGVTLTNANPAAVPYIRMLNRFYGRGDLPVGAAIKELKGGSGDGYMAAALRKMPAATASPAEPAPAVLRRLLSNAPEKVVIVQTGFSTNLAALLDLPGGAELAKEKVALVVAMAGNFAGGEPEYNVRIDIASAKAVFERWPTPIVFSGFEIGRELLYPAQSIEHDFTYANPHPIAESYRAYQKMPYNRPTWDLTAALQAVRPDHGYFTLSEPGTVRVDEKGVTHFTAGDADRRYLRLDPAKRAEILEILALLSSEPPLRR